LRNHLKTFDQGTIQLETGSQTRLIFQFKGITWYYQLINRMARSQTNNYLIYLQSHIFC
jgi:hypothetical protein